MNYLLILILACISGRASYPLHVEPIETEVQKIKIISFLEKIYQPECVYNGNEEYSYEYSVGEKNKEYKIPFKDWYRYYFKNDSNTFFFMPKDINQKFQLSLCDSSIESLPIKIAKITKSTNESYILYDNLENPNFIVFYSGLL